MNVMEKKPEFIMLISAVALSVPVTYGREYLCFFDVICYLFFWAVLCCNSCTIGSRSSLCKMVSEFSTETITEVLLNK